MSNFKYRAKQNVQAVQWREDNLDEMKELLKDIVESDQDGPFVFADYIEPYFFASRHTGETLIDNPGYYMLKIEYDEFDPGQWVVVYEDGEVEGMDNDQFNKMFEKS